MNQFTIRCLWCNELFVNVLKSDAKYCSRQHKERAKQKRMNDLKRSLRIKSVPVYKYQINCRECGLFIETNDATKRSCSSTCSDKYRKRITKARDKDYHNARTTAFKNRIYWNSQGICQICMNPIDTRIKYPNQLSFSIDHIKPRSLGGSHAFYNLQAAHLICNLRKGEQYDE